MMSARKKRKKPDPGSGEEGGEEAGAEKRSSNAAAEWTKSILIAAALFLILRTFLVQTFVITSGSMEETLLVGDMLVVNRAAIGSRIPVVGLRIPGYSEPRLRDVLVFDPPHEDFKLVKRLVGMPGDTLQMIEGVLYRNGEAQEEPYVKHEGGRDEAHPWMVLNQKDYLLPGGDPATYAPTRDNWGPLVLPPDRYFMLGDNRDSSFDSRYWGLLEGWRLEGRAVFTYFSYDKESYRPFPWIREIRWGRIGRLIR